MAESELEESLGNIEVLDFDGFREKMKIEIGTIQNPTAQAHMCMALARHFKYLSRIDSIKESAKEEALNYLQRAQEYTEKALK